MNNNKIPYPYYQICCKCGKKYGIKNKTVIGIWKDLCPICGKITSCAVAGHDFGVYEIDSNLIKKENIFKNGKQEKKQKAKTKKKSS